MAKSIRQIVLNHRYRYEGAIVCVTLLLAVAVISTIVMFFFSRSKAMLLLVVSVLFAALLIYLRLFKNMRLRASITTLRNAHAMRKRPHKQGKTAK